MAEEIRESKEQDMMMDRVIKTIGDLPDDVLFHILSFLDDAQSLVRTGVLCKRWRTLWKDTPALNLCCGDRASLRIHVEKLLLSLGSDPKQSLRTLRLAQSRFQGPSGFSGFSSLTTLELRDCSFDGKNVVGYSAILLPFADLPSLKYLKLLHCWSNDHVIVSVPHVLDMEIQTRNSYGFQIEQLLAPKLESFTFSSYVIGLVDPRHGEVCYGLPSLDHASIRLVWKHVSHAVVITEKLERVFMTFFRSMCFFE